jgi:hypothetical protein
VAVVAHEDLSVAGPIPDSYGELRKLRILKLASNNLSGTFQILTFQPPGGKT